MHIFREGNTFIGYIDQPQLCNLRLGMKLNRIVDENELRQMVTLKHYIIEHVTMTALFLRDKPVLDALEAAGLSGLHQWAAQWSYWFGEEEQDVDNDTECCGASGGPDGLQAGASS